MRIAFEVLLTSLILVFPIGALNAQTDFIPDPPLRNDPLPLIIQDLDEYIPEQMIHEDVTGLSIALLNDHQIVWKKGYGYVSSLSRKPVTPETIFSAASCGKAVSAYLALRMLQDSLITLEDPLFTLFNEPWVPRTEQHDQINLGHLLTHTSGLSNFLRDKKRTLRFEPGQEFAYSGVGYMYLQAVIEQLSTSSLDKIMLEKVFDPLQMSSSYYGMSTDIPTPLVTHGHIGFGRATAPFLIIFIPAFLGLLIIYLFLNRLIQKTWNPNRIALWILFSISVVGTGVFLLLKAGGAVMAIFFTLCGLFIVACLGFLYVTMSRVLNYNKSVRPPAHQFISFISSLVLSIWIFVTIANRPIPLPNWFPTEGNAASSLRTTATDLGNFLIEIAEPKFLDSTIIADMITRKVKVNEHVSWGLGVAIQHSKNGDAIWHWGSNPGSKSMMVIYPDSGTGIVILTNSSNASNLVAEVVERALGGKAFWDF